MRRNNPSLSLLVILLIVGLLLGDVIGQAIGRYVPLLSYGKNIGLSTTKLDLGMANLTLGFGVNLNLGGALGLIAAILLYKRM